MVEAQLIQRGIRDERVLAAFRHVPREAFVPADQIDKAYADSPLPIGESQTLSQPYIVALTVESLRLVGGERVLEIGTGSGYAAAILSRIASEVYTVERLPSLADGAREKLSALGYDNVHVLTGDGSLGWPTYAPYDAIAVAASGPRIPESLQAQLAVGGRLVLPVGADEWNQRLVRVTRDSAVRYHEEELAQVRFVPLIGREGWGMSP